IHRVMSSPVITVGRSTQVYEALLLMQERKIEHLPVTDEDGKIIGMVCNRDILQRHSYGAIVLTREIEQAATPEDVTQWCRRTPMLVKALLDCGAHPRSATRMIADICDAATERLLALAIAQAGPPPVDFAFVALGSQARQEQTLLTDQDNAILYDGPESEAAIRYFGELGRCVCEGLDRSGYAFCHGKVMAMNPMWCCSLETWKNHFTTWIARAEPQELLDFAIFFDLRTVGSDDRLRKELRGQINAALSGNPAFFPHFARSALQFKPPTRWFGFTLQRTPQPRLDLKAALMPLVCFARLYALKHELEETHTLDRIDALARCGVLSTGSRTEIVAAYEFLMRLRLRQQAEALSAGLPLDNHINPARLGRLEQTQLHQAFTQINVVQKRISYDFLGGT
ncbi:MAG: DUF294 nucleotidyltransferase-like domain-containing protein, partial [Desulforhabdus sp.]|nr:DUF294 nucleotidyltransferase-like domain-containing protein [Desulforhabdus sp.]